MKNVIGSNVLATFVHPQNHKNPQQQTFRIFFKFAFSLERCRKNQVWHSHAAWESFFCLTPMQRGNANSEFCDTSPARMLFFMFLPHVPSGKLRNHENALVEPVCRRLVFKKRFANCYKNPSLLWRARHLPKV